MVVDNSGMIAALEVAIGSGSRSISYEGKSITYASLDEMIKAIAYLKRAEIRANGGKVSTVGLASFDRGYRRR